MFATRKIIELASALECETEGLKAALWGVEEFPAGRIGTMLVHLV